MCVFSAIKAYMSQTSRYLLLKSNDFIKCATFAFDSIVHAGPSIAVLRAGLRQVVAQKGLAKLGSCISNGPHGFLGNTQVALHLERWHAR